MVSATGLLKVTQCPPSSHSEREEFEKPLNTLYQSVDKVTNVWNLIKKACTKIGFLRVPAYIAKWANYL